jgi:hypothetical protein
MRPNTRFKRVVGEGDEFEVRTQYSVLVFIRGWEPKMLRKCWNKRGGRWASNRKKKGFERISIRHPG